MDRAVGHPAWAPEGREGRSQAGPKPRQLEVRLRRGSRLLKYSKFISWIILVKLMADMGEAGYRKYNIVYIY